MLQRCHAVGGADVRPYVFVHITLECEEGGGVRTLQLLLKLVCELAKLGLRVNVWCLAPLLAARSPFLHHYPFPLRPRPPPSPSAIPILVSACAARARACVRVGRETGRVERHRKGSNCASFIASRTSSGPRTCSTQPPRALLPLGMSRRSRVDLGDRSHPRSVRKRTFFCRCLQQSQALHQPQLCITARPANLRARARTAPLCSARNMTPTTTAQGGLPLRRWHQVAEPHQQSA